MTDPIDRSAERRAQRASRAAQRERLKTARKDELAAARRDALDQRERDAADRAAGRSTGPSPRQRALVIAARISTGVSGVLAAALVLGGVAFVTWPSWGIAAPVTVVQPDSAAQQRACPGPFLTVGANAKEATRVSSAGEATVVTSGGAATELSSSNPQSARDGSAQVFTAPAADSPLAASQLQSLSSETLRGLAAAACTEPTTDAWLVAGSSEVGRVSVLSIANPGSIAATVAVALWGAGGPIAVDSVAYSVNPGEQLQLPLAGFAVNEPTPVVHVTSQGAPVSVAVHESAIFGLNPIGIDVVGPSAAPATTVVIPGVVLTDSGLAAGDGGSGPTVRALAVDADSSATITVISDDGVTASSTAQLTAGTVATLPLPDVEAGTYRVQISADHPILAGVRVTTASENGNDFAWFSSAAPLADTVTVVTGPADGTLLHFVNPGSAEAKLSGSDGATLTVPAGGAVSLPIGPEVVTWSGTSGLFGSVSFGSDSAVASFTLQASGSAVDAVTVYTR